MEGKKVTANCFKCRKQVEIKIPEKTDSKDGKPAEPSVCPTCGGKLFRIG